MRVNQRKRWVRTAGALAALACVLLLPACAPQRATPEMILAEPVAPELKPVQSTERFRREYVLAPGDQLEVVVRQAPEASRTVLIRPDGRLTLPLVEEVIAAGLTPAELDARLTERFSERLIDPEVTVIASMVRQPMVYVTGHVRQPQAVPLRDAPHAIHAVAIAGGLQPSAAAKVIVVIRLTEDGYVRAIPIELQGRGQPHPYMALKSIALQADDVIFVPQSNRAQTAKFIDEFLLRPFWAVNQALQSYTAYRIIRDDL